MAGENKKAVVLVSGGLDSTTCLAIAKREGFEVFALSFDYGQRHRAEIKAAEMVAKAFGAKKHLVLNVPLGAIGGSALTAGIEVPKDVPVEDMQAQIPVTYVPAQKHGFPLPCPRMGRDAKCGGYLYRRKRPGLLRLSRLPAGIHRIFRKNGKPGPEGMCRRPHAHSHSYPPYRYDQGADHKNGGGTGGRLLDDPFLLRSRSGWKSVRQMRQLHFAKKRLCRGRHTGPDTICMDS